MTARMRRMSGHDGDESLVAGLVADVARAPGAYRDVETLAAAAGVSTDTLEALFGTYFHTAPADMLARLRVAAARRALLANRRRVADIAHEAGFQSLAAFNESFQRHTAMSPPHYRRLLERPDFTLRLPEDYPIDRMLRYLGRDRHSLTERVEGRTYTAALNLNLEDHPPVAVEVALAPGVARCRVHGATMPAALAQVQERLLRTLGLTGDPTVFESWILGSPELAPLIENQRGLRVPLLSDPFDALIWAIVGQQINLAFTFRLRRRLVERVGVRVRGDLYAPPTPEAVAALEPSDLSPLSFSRAKSEYLIGAARWIVDGRLPLADLAEKPATHIERALLAVRGIGPWSANYLLMRCFGFLDCVPVGDAGLIHGLRLFFKLDARPGTLETLALMDRFRPYRSLATFHLWQRIGTAA